MAGEFISAHTIYPLLKEGLWAAGEGQETQGLEVVKAAAAPCQELSKNPVASWLFAQNQWEVHKPAWWEHRTDVRLPFSPRSPNQSLGDRCIVLPVRMAAGQGAVSPPLLPAAGSQGCTSQHSQDGPHVVLGAS